MFILLVLVLLVYFLLIQSDFYFSEKPLLGLKVFSHGLKAFGSLKVRKIHANSNHSQPLILLISANDNNFSDDAKLIMYVADSLRISIHTLHPISFFIQIPKLVQTKSFQLLIFEDISVYFSLSSVGREILDSYCKMNSVGVIGFLKNPFTLKSLDGNENFSEVRLDLYYT